MHALTVQTIKTQKYQNP